MRTLAASVILLALVLVGLARSPLPKGIVPEPANEGIPLELKLNRGCFASKERLSLQVELGKPAYVYIFNIDSQGRVWLLFPNAFSPTSYLKAGTHVFPDSSRYSFVIQGPAGTEYIQAIASPTPIPLLEHTGQELFSSLGKNAATFANGLSVWLREHLPSGSWATDWAEYKVDFGKIIVSGEPAEATVYVDGNPTGRVEKGKEGSSKLVLWLPKGRHRVTVTKQGFRSLTRTVYISPCKTSVVQFYLEKLALLVLGSIPLGAAVYVDGTYRGTTPLELEVEPGYHRVELELSGYKPWKEEVRLAPGDRIEKWPKLRENLPPHAAFSASPEEPLAGEDVIFDASASYDPDGEIVDYLWDFDGDGIPDATGEIVRWAFQRPGRYHVRLEVVDDDGGTDHASLYLRVRACPVASFSVPAGALFVDTPIGFDASSSYDPDGRITSYEWDFGDGHRARGRRVSHSYGASGKYTVILTVTDDEGLVDKEVKTIRVFRGGTLSISSAPPGAAVYLDGSYIGETPLETEKLIAGTYRITLKLTGYRSWSTTVTVPQTDSVTAELVPLGKLHLSSTPRGADVYLDGHRVGETTSDGLTLYFEGQHTIKMLLCGYLAWEKEIELSSGETRELAVQFEPIGEVLVETEPSGADIYLNGKLAGRTPASIPLEPSPNELKLVKNGYKPWSTTCVTEDKIQVILKPNESPVARIEAPREARVSEEVGFSARNSYDPDGEIVSYIWDFGDGESGTGAYVQHSYTQTGSYTVRLSVTDEDGARAEATWEIIIVPAAEAPAEEAERPSAPGEESMEAGVSYIFGFDFGQNRAGTASMGIYLGKQLVLGASLSFTGDAVPDFYEVPPQPWEGEVYNLGPEWELFALRGIQVTDRVSIYLGLGFAVQEQVHIAVPKVQGGALIPQRAAVLPNGYRQWVWHPTFQARLLLSFGHLGLQLGWHYRRGWLFGACLEF